MFFSSIHTFAICIYLIKICKQVYKSDQIQQWVFLIKYVHLIFLFVQNSIISSTVIIFSK